LCLYLSASKKINSICFETKMSQNEGNKQKTGENAQVTQKEQDEQQHYEEGGDQEHTFDGGPEGENEESKNPNDSKHEEGGDEHHEIPQDIQDMDQACKP
jgi:hypothetical protein